MWQGCENHEKCPHRWVPGKLNTGKQVIHRNSCNLTKNFLIS